MEESSTNKSIPEQNKTNYWFAVVIFTLIGICVFLTEKKEGGFIPGGLYSGVSVHGITLAKNLMYSDHLLFMYSSKEIKNGKITYDAYNRFPVFPFLLTGILIHPFDTNLSFQIYWARQIMNLFFFLSFIAGFKVIKELTNNTYLALSVVIVSFSSYYMLTYNNLIFNDIPALLGFMIALLCAVQAQKAPLKKSSILFYAIIPISLGWQPYFVFITWFIFDSLELLLKKDTSLKSRITGLFKQNSFTVTALAVLWGVAILGSQLLNEWRIIGGSFVDLPSVNSALWRSGLSSAAGHTQYVWLFNWFNYLPAQAKSMTTMLIPFWPVFKVDPGINFSIFVVISVMIYFLLRYIKDKNGANKVYIIMIFSGLAWALLMKEFVSMHEFQSIFYIGFSMSFFILLFSKINLLSLKLLTINLTVFFMITIALSNHYKTPNIGMNKLALQFKSITSTLPQNSKVYFDGDRFKIVERHAVDFFLVGHSFAQKENAEYAISDNPDFLGDKLTANKGFNLFRIR